MKIKYVLFICGGKWQIPWIQYLKYKGHKIIIVDPYSFSPAVPLADIHIACDAKDIETIYSKIISENFEIEFVTSDQTDVSTNTVALLSEKLGLIGNKPEIVKFFSNKFENRSFLKKHFNSHYPKFIKAYNKEEIITFFNSTSNNIIIKPVDAQSSRGIFKIDDSNLQHIQVLYDEAVSFSQQNYVIAEEFVIGKEITVEGICIENRHYTLATSSKNHFRTGIASELRYPAKINHTLMNKIYQFHNRFIEKTGLNFGITHSEYIVNNEETDFWLVEAACRGGGSLIPSHIVPWVSGVNVYDCFYKILTQQKVKISQPENHRHGILYFFEFPNGKVNNIKGLAEAKKIDGVFDIELEFKEGSILKAANDDRGRQGYTIIFAETSSQLDERLNQVINTLKVSVE